MSTETVYYKSPAGIIKLTAEDDSLTELFFASTEKNGIKEESIKDFAAADMPVLQKTVQQLEEYFAGQRMEFNLPMNQKGTPFQQKVWAGLMNIKAGNTLSYLAFSKRLGDTKAIRAVGTANGKNNISIIVPCHRVIGSNGSLVGYGGDMWRKKWLLDHEAKFTNGVQKLFADEHFER
ncbi:MAG: methylated-DNA--[protein]-cysteine S-methyltransferase [Rhizobacter sp.]|nr:methylated-DNA--[protein]-cysteine S-methyltransferase [Ferruginibacter sp.]